MKITLLLDNMTLIYWQRNMPTEQWL